MSEPAPSGPPADASISARLHQLARLLREAQHLGPELQTELANLIDELRQALPAGTPLGGDQAHLAESAAHLVHAIHQRQNAGLLEAAKMRLEDAALRAQAEAPVAAGIVRRLIETLANLGI
jgi:hypothetical protein